LQLRVRAHIQEQASAGGRRAKQGWKHAGDPLVPMASGYNADEARGYVILITKRL
jgi:hypothetical protein